MQVDQQNEVKQPVRSEEPKLTEHRPRGPFFAALVDSCASSRSAGCNRGFWNSASH